uniref:Acyltransferase n=1 Tax=Eptatretus burgeri TaxID=7764 RepID=A0A8C4QLR7_EPTBU
MLQPSFIYNSVVKRKCRCLCVLSPFHSPHAALPLSTPPHPKDISRWSRAVFNIPHFVQSCTILSHPLSPSPQVPPQRIQNPFPSRLPPTHFSPPLPPHSPRSYLPPFSLPTLLAPLFLYLPLFSPPPLHIPGFFSDYYFLIYWMSHQPYLLPNLILQLVKTTELPPNKNYLFGYHPHGLMSIGAFCHFATEGSGFSLTFPGLHAHLATLYFNFYMPLYRDYLMAGGVCPASRSALGSLLSHPGGGNVVAIVIGGAAEALACHPGATSLHLNQRRGFVRLALQHGADLVPVYSFGENERYKQHTFPDGSLIRRVQEWCRQTLSFSPCALRGSWGILPFRTPIHTIVGAPIPVPLVPDPPAELVERIHERYAAALVHLFDTHKCSFGLRDADKLHLL